MIESLWKAARELIWNKCQEAILWTTSVMASCFWIIMFPLSDSRHTTGISVESEVSLAACWARTNSAPACSSHRVPRQPRLSPYESVHRTQTVDRFFIVSSNGCSKVASILPAIHLGSQLIVTFLLYRLFFTFWFFCNNA